jgi:integrase
MTRKKIRGNGDGSIFKMSGKRKKPWAARITIGYKQNGQQQYKYIGFFETKTQAKNALNEYLVNPLNVIVEKATLQFIFDNMINKSKFSDGTIKQYRSSFNKLKNLHHKEISKISLAELEAVLEDKTPSVQSNIKKVLTNCYHYAMKHEYVNKNLSEFIELDKTTEKAVKTPFKTVEIKNLWNTLGTQLNDDIPLILLYTGMRISELLYVENKNVNFEDKYIFVAKSKTKAGIRNVPMHDKIIPLLKARYNLNNKYLITQKGKKLSYHNLYLNYWYVKNHTIHETRHTFITFLNKCGVDDLTVKRIVGHSDKDITENYTHRTQSELLEAINKLEYK